MTRNKIKVCISPLNWGLGHATRIIPLIHEFKTQHFDVVIGSSGSAGKLLKKEFPELRHVSLPGFTVRYHGLKSQAFSILMQIPRFILSIMRDYQKLKSLMKKEKFDIIISDNRYGFRNKNAFCVFITHQINIRLPVRFQFFQRFINGINHRLIMKFDECWIPDFQEESNLGGRLSHPLPGGINAKYIGAISRFSSMQKQIPGGTKKNIPVLALVSGPEVQQSIFRTLLERHLKQLQKDFILLPSKKEDYAGTKEIYQSLRNSNLVICRSGYTSIMDLVALNKRAILVPTPGQTEQEYLAHWHTAKEIFGMLKQNEISEKIQELHQHKENTELKQKLQAMMKEERFKKYVADLSNRLKTTEKQ